MTAYLDEHPGGADVLRSLDGLDASHAFDEVCHSKAAKRRLRTLFVDGGADAPVQDDDEPSWRSKLFTHEDRWNVHKVFAVVVVLHFAALRPLRLAEGPAAAAAVSCAVAALALSSLRFRVPTRSDAHRPAIHAMFRAHSVLFSLRSALCALANCLLPPQAARAS